MNITTDRRSFIHATSVTVLTAAAYSRVLGANERVALGLIGYGLIGKTHTATFSKIPACQIVGVADCHRKRADQGVTAVGGGATAYQDFRKLLDCKDVQAVIVATPDHWHALMGMMACAAGKDVYVEKPVSHNITEGRRMVQAARKLGLELAEGALLASLADDTAEGKSIVEYLRALHPQAEPSLDELTAVPFSAETRLSGVDYQGRVFRKGAVDSLLAFIGQPRGDLQPALSREIDKIAQSGGTPLLVAGAGRLLGAIHLKDVVKPGIRERFAELRAMGIRTVMVTGDNPLTAAAIAAEAGVDDVIAEATPEKKLQRIRSEQAEGKMVAMCGDGANDAPALAQADVGLAMNDGTQAAREAANLVDLDSDPTKLLDVVQVGKELLVTRGALTTFSVANDVAKYFAILPALFTGIYPQLGALNLMQLHSPQSAILSAIVFNALIIVALIPLALRGVRVQAADAASLLRRNLLIYGLGGLVAPFVGIKLIDLLLVAVGLV